MDGSGSSDGWLRLPRFVTSPFSSRSSPTKSAPTSAASPPHTPTAAAAAAGVGVGSGVGASTDGASAGVRIGGAGGRASRLSGSSSNRDGHGGFGAGAGPAPGTSYTGTSISMGTFSASSAPATTSAATGAASAAFGRLTVLSNALHAGPLDATYHANAPLSCLDLNHTRDCAVLAGRNALKIVRMEGSSVREEFNIQKAVTEKQRGSTGGVNNRMLLTRETFDIHDVKWCHGRYNSVVATAAAFSRLIVYDLAVGGMICANVATDVLRDRHREKYGLSVGRLNGHVSQVHKLAFSPHRSGELLSGSQDGSVRLWDLRDLRTEANTFAPPMGGGYLPIETVSSRGRFGGGGGANSSVRDVKWSPADEHTFAAATDGGNVLIWDVRYAKSARSTVVGHSGLTAAIDWHPAGRWIASGGSDSIVKFWDSNLGSGPANWSFHTPFPVANVQWRPPSMSGETAQICVSYSRDSPQMHVWDLRRPHLPLWEVLLPFADTTAGGGENVADDENRILYHPTLSTDYAHRSAPADLIWHSRDVIWAAGKDGLFCQVDVESGKLAYRPIERRTLTHVSVGQRGEGIVVGSRRERLKYVGGKRVSEHKPEVVDIKVLEADRKRIGLPVVRPQSVQTGLVSGPVMAQGSALARAVAILKAREGAVPAPLLPKGEKRDERRDERKRRKRERRLDKERRRRAQGVDTALDGIFLSRGTRTTGPADDGEAVDTSPSKEPVGFSNSMAAAFAAVKGRLADQPENGLSPPPPPIWPPSEVRPEERAAAERAAEAEFEGGDSRWELGESVGSGSITSGQASFAGSAIPMSMCTTVRVIPLDETMKRTREMDIEPPAQWCSRVSLPGSAPLLALSDLTRGLPKSVDGPRLFLPKRLIKAIRKGLTMPDPGEEEVERIAKLLISVFEANARIRDRSTYRRASQAFRIIGLVSSWWLIERIAAASLAMEDRLDDLFERNTSRPPSASSSVLTSNSTSSFAANYFSLEQYQPGYTWLPEMMASPAPPRSLDRGSDTARQSLPLLGTLGRDFDGPMPEHSPSLRIPSPGYPIRLPVLLSRMVLVFSQTARTADVLGQLLLLIFPILSLGPAEDRPIPSAHLVSLSALRIALESSSSAIFEADRSLIPAAMKILYKVSHTLDPALIESVLCTFIDQLARRREAVTAAAIRRIVFPIFVSVWEAGCNDVLIGFGGGRCGRAVKGVYSDGGLSVNSGPWVSQNKKNSENSWNPTVSDVPLHLDDEEEHRGMRTVLAPSTSIVTWRGASCESRQKCVSRNQHPDDLTGAACDICFSTQSPFAVPYKSSCRIQQDGTGNKHNDNLISATSIGLGLGFFADAHPQGFFAELAAAESGVGKWHGGRGDHILRVSGKTDPSETVLYPPPVCPSRLSACLRCSHVAHAACKKEWFGTVKRYHQARPVGRNNTAAFLSDLTADVPGSELSFTTASAVAEGQCHFPGCVCMCVAVEEEKDRAACSSTDSLLSARSDVRTPQTARFRSGTAPFSSAPAVPPVRDELIALAGNESEDSEPYPEMASVFEGNYSASESESDYDSEEGECSDTELATRSFDVSQAGRKKAGPGSSAVSAGEGGSAHDRGKRSKPTILGALFGRKR